MGDNCMWKHTGSTTQAPAPKAKAKAKARARSQPPPQAAATEGMTKEQAEAKIAKLRKQKEKLDARLGKAAVAAAGVGAPTKSAARRARSKVRREFGLQGAAVPQNAAVPIEDNVEKEYDAIGMCAVPVGSIPNDFWDALDTLKQVADEVPNMKLTPGPSRRGTSLAGLPPRRWLNDTGARYDMIGKNELVDDPSTWTAVRKSKKPQTILTGNGVTTVENEIQLCSASLGEQLTPMLLNKCPAALGTGYRCMEQGYGFY